MEEPWKLSQNALLAQSMSYFRLDRCRRRPAIVTILLLVLFLAPLVNAQSETGNTPEEKAIHKMQEREAAGALRRLKRAIDKDGFYSGRVALNVWRSSAMDAGTFDQAQYDEFKKRLYEKSVSDSKRCFEEFVLEENFYDANFCLQTWRMHAKELGTYDETEYEALVKKLAEAKAAKAKTSEKAKQ